MSTDIFAPISEAAKSGYGVVIYIAALAVWLIVALKVRSHKTLLQHLQKLPANDRLAAFKVQMDHVDVPPSMTPEQWLRSRLHRHYFLAFVVLCVIMLLGVIVLTSGETKKPGQTATTMGLLPEDLTRKIVRGEVGSDQKGTSSSATSKGARDGDWRDVSLNHPKTYEMDPLLKVQYKFTRKGAIGIVEPDGPYLTRLRENQTVRSVSTETPFDWGWYYPILSVRTVNNTNRTVYLTEAVVRVLHSELNTDPVLVIPDFTPDLWIGNEGWGKALDGVLHFGFVRLPANFEGDVLNLAIDKSPSFITKIGTIASGKGHMIQLRSEHMPPGVKIARRTGEDGSNFGLCMFGYLDYRTEQGELRRFRFRARVNLVPGGAEGELSRHIYDVKLLVDKDGYEERLYLSQYIKPGEIDNFPLRFVSERSGRFDVEIRFLTAEGTVLSSQRLHLELFVPFTAWRDGVGGVKAPVFVRGKRFQKPRN